MTMTKPIAEQIITLALGIERGDIYPHSAGRKLRALAEQTRATMEKLEARVAELSERLEIAGCWQEVGGKLQLVTAEQPLGFECDGIACRDETIRLQEEELRALAEQVCVLEDELSDLGVEAIQLRNQLSDAVRRETEWRELYERLEAREEARLSAIAASGPLADSSYNRAPHGAGPGSKP